MFLISPYSFQSTINTKLIDEITDLGLTSGLELCLDAGDLNSYASGQTWEDVSGNGYDFLRGTTSSSQSNDPTFNGTPGDQSSSEYWSFDGGDYFTLGQANPTWVNNVHKNNATVTFASWIYLGSTGDGTFCGTYSGGVGTPSFTWYPSSANKLGFSAGNGTDLVIDVRTVATIGSSAWAFVAVSIDEAGNSAILQINATQENFAGAYASPSSSNAGATIKIGADGDTTFPLDSGSRMGGFMAWSTALSAVQLTAVYDATRGKFGL